MTAMVSIHVARAELEAKKQGTIGFSVEDVLEHDDLLRWGLGDDAVTVGHPLEFPPPTGENTQ